MKDRLQVKGEWVVKERVNGLWIPVLRRTNSLTDFGLTALAGAWVGGYIAPIYLAVKESYSTLANLSSTGVGATSIDTDTDPTLAGDTKLVLGVGLITQEEVTFTSKTGTGPYTFTLSTPTVNNHDPGEKVVRKPLTTDSIATMQTEMQYDSVNAPNQRLTRVAGYSSGVGINTIQFYFTGTQAVNKHFITIGLADTLTVNTGNLHNVFVLGYDHTNSNDVEIDGTLTIVNN